MKLYCDIVAVRDWFQGREAPAILYFLKRLFSQSGTKGGANAIEFDWLSPDHVVHNKTP